MIERDAMLDELRYKILCARQRMKLQEDKRRREVEFQEGDKVLLQLQPYRQKALARCLCEKLSARFYGPFGVIQILGTLVYKLQLPESYKIHPVFQVSQLKVAMGIIEVFTTIPETTSADLELVTESKDIVGICNAVRNNSAEVEVLVKWKEIAKYKAIWEIFATIKRCFPLFHIEDKVGRYCK